MNFLESILAKIDYRLSSNVISRPNRQVVSTLENFKTIHETKFNKLLDIGGGREANYKSALEAICKHYINLELKKGAHVDLVGDVYDIPLKNSSVDVAVAFTVLEHLNRPVEALRECRRVMKKGGYLALTTVQYWHTHNHPSDYFRYTKAGLEYVCKEAGLTIVDIWSIGGPFLVVFHAIELNLPGVWRTIFSILFYRLFDWLDWAVFKHSDTREHSDSVGWALIAKKT